MLIKMLSMNNLCMTSNIGIMIIESKGILCPIWSLMQSSWEYYATSGPSWPPRNWESVQEGCIKSCIPVAV